MGYPKGLSPWVPHRIFFLDIASVPFYPLRMENDSGEEDGMNVYEAIEKRRTIRVFKQPATEEQVRRIILAGAKAPSGMNSQPWEFILVNDPQIIARLAEIKYRMNRKFSPGAGETQKDVEERALNQQKWFKNSSVVAICTTAGQSASGWLAVENMSLAAVEDGLGTNIIAYRNDAKKEVEKLLGLPQEYELTCVLKIGVPAEEGTPRRWRPESSWLHRNKF